MGVVYAAYDPELDRKVAIKLLHAGSAADAQARLVREAQAMAKLSHPNVVPVYDVGVHDKAVYVAMEFVEGGTLRDWLEAEPRRWSKIVAAFVAAGRGLAAAHEAGFIHRDFKPDNVLIGKRGQVRVTDFGLARLGRRPEAAGAVAPATIAEGSALMTPLTVDGAVMGTPAYMAPEQLFGGPVDHRADQWAFCVALWEALHGARPFRGQNMVDLAIAIKEGRPTKPEASDAQRPHTRPTTVPRWLERVLLRGLSAKSEERFGSMAEILAQLERDRGRALRLAGLAGLIVAVAMASWVVARQKEEAEDPCALAGQAMDEAWNPDVESELRAAFESTGLPYAARAADEARDKIDGFADAWRQEDRKACAREPNAEGTDSSEVSVRVDACLGHYRRVLLEKRKLLLSGDPNVVEKVTNVLATLPEVPPCDLDSLADAPRPPAEADRPRIDGLRGDLVRARDLTEIGERREAAAVVADVLSQSRTIEYPLLRGEALLAAARLAYLDGHVEQSVSEYGSAFVHLGESRDLDGAIESATGLAKILSAHGGNRPRAEDWVTVVDALTGRKDPLARDREATRSRLTGLAAMHESPSDAARDLRGAYEVLRATRDPEDDELAQVATELTVALSNLGEHAAAIPLLREVAESRRGRYGPSHPRYAVALWSLGRGQDETGDSPAAEASYREALQILTQPGRDPDPNVAMVEADLGALIFLRDPCRPSEALKIYEHALEIARQRPELRGELAQILRLLGVASARVDREKARRYLRESVALARAAGNPVGELLSLQYLAELDAEAGDQRQAKANIERAQELALRFGSPFHLVSVKSAAMEIWLRQRDVERALETGKWLVEHAHSGRPAGVPWSYFQLARALHLENRKNAEARRLAIFARDIFASLGKAENQERAKIDAWLAGDSPDAFGDVCPTAEEADH